MRLKQILKEKGMTAKQLAAKMGISEVGLSLALKNSSFSLTRLREIAANLDCNVSDLLTDEDTHIKTQRDFFAQVYDDGKLYAAGSLEELRVIVNVLSSRQTK